MAVPDLMIEPLADALLDCLKTEVKKTPNPPKRVGHRVGDVMVFLLSLREDECCEGVAWVRWADAYPSVNLGEPVGDMTQIEVSGATPFWTIVFEIGVGRCAPRDPKVLPSVATWDDLASNIYADQAALRRAACCFADTPRRKGKVLLGPAGPIANEGGCAGSVLAVNYRGPSCEC